MQTVSYSCPASLTGAYFGINNYVSRETKSTVCDVESMRTQNSSAISRQMIWKNLKADIRILDFMKIEWIPTYLWLIF